jgi:hypothetical protein
MNREEKERKIKRKRKGLNNFFIEKRRKAKHIGLSGLVW